VALLTNKQKQADKQINAG